MSLRINFNAASYNAYRNLSVSDSSMAKSLEKLSSGFRINRAGDDASGLVKSEQLRAAVRGNQQAIRNAQDGVSFVQVAEGALNEVHSILQRMRELAVSAANTATSDGTAEQAEVDELVNELVAIGSNTKFAGNAVFNANVTFQVGADSGNTISISVSNLALTDVGGQDLTAFDVTGAGAIGTLDSAIGGISTLRGTLGATQNRLEHTVANLQVAVENLSASESRIRDTDMALEMANFTRHQIMVQAGTAMLAQANSVPSSVLRLLQ